MKRGLIIGVAAMVLVSNIIPAVKSVAYEVNKSEAYNKQFENEDSSRCGVKDYKNIIDIINSPEDSTILFAGDSITHGIHHLKGYRSYSEHFNERLRGEEVNGNRKTRSFVINTGVSSATTRDALRQFDTWIATHSPKIVFLTFGMNDCVAMNVQEYKENLKTLVSKVREIGAIPIIQTINTTNGAREQELPPFMQGAREVAKELDVFLIDQNKYWLDQGKDITKAWMGDGIHPNEIGHLEMAKLIFRELKLDNSESYTANLSYPLEGNGMAKPIIESRVYPEYSKIQGIEPVVSYKVNKEFNGRDFIDISDDIDKIKSLSNGAIVSRFNLTSAGQAQTIISLSDSKDPSKEVAVGLNANGTIFLNGRTDNGICNFTTRRNGYNDGRWHTLVMNFNENNIDIYVDGEKIHSTGNKVFFTSLNSPTNFSIGRNVHNEGGEWFFNGAISYAEVYSNVLTEEQINSININNNKEDEFKAIRDKAIEDGVANSWVLLGDNSTAGKGTTYGYKNYGEYFEERIRWELRGTPMINRERFVVNAGVDGATSEDILANFENWATEFEPELISIMIGGKETITPTKFEENLRGIVEKSKAIGATVMLQTPVLQDRDIKEYVDVILKVGKENNIPVVDHYNKWLELEKDNPHLKETWLNENYEPNHRGHLRIAQDMMKAMNIFDKNSLSGGAKVDMKYEDM